MLQSTKSCYFAKKKKSSITDFGDRYKSVSFGEYNLICYFWCVSYELTMQLEKYFLLYLFFYQNMHKSQT